MKKFLIAALVMLGLSTASFAQTKPAKKAATTAVKPAATPAATTAGPLKKDGTADKRYKANKTAATPAKPVKKDGTPDMRYKENKKKKA